MSSRGGASGFPLSVRLNEAEGGHQRAVLLGALLGDDVDLADAMIDLQEPQRRLEPGDLPLLGLQLALFRLQVAFRGV